MIFQQKTVTLKNGATATLRSPLESDAEQLIEYLKACANETHFVLRTQEECTDTVEQERAYIHNINESAERLMIVAVVDGEIAGNCALVIPLRKRIAHRATVAIALKQKFWNMGIGTVMFEQLIDLARQNGCIQMELEVIEGNERAKALYHKMGFATVAIKPNAIRLSDGTLLNLEWMYKPL